MCAALVAACAIVSPAAASAAEPGDVTLYIVDAETREPVRDACVDLVSDNRHGVVETRVMVRCADSEGAVRFYGWTTRFKIFTWSKDGLHGSQWTGKWGGTGDIDQATWFHPELGDSIELKVAMHKAGQISGVVTDSATGAPVPGLCPMPTPSGTYWSNHVGVKCADTEGRYSISGLGPYAWKVQFPDYSGNYAWQWSGNGSNRAEATPVQVTVGATAAADARLYPAGGVTGKVIDSPESMQFVSIDAFNRLTGDWAGPQPSKDDATKTYLLRGLNTQDVEIRYRAMGTPEYVYPDPVRVVAGQKTDGIDLKFPKEN
nr:hypothetical protein [Kibdelosporangium sp. MJ126-NF4]